MTCQWIHRQNSEGVGFPFGKKYKNFPPPQKLLYFGTSPAYWIRIAIKEPDRLNPKFHNQDEVVLILVMCGDYFESQAGAPRC